MSTAAPTVERSVRSVQRRRLRRRVARRPLAVLGLLGIVVVAVAAPLLTPYDPSVGNFAAVLQPPFSPGHLLGTDDLGRDLLARLMYGARASLLAGVVSTLVAMVVAVPLGIVSSYHRGFLDSVISRANDVLLSFPFLILAVGLAAILGPSLLNAIIALAIGQVPAFLRIARGETLGLREQDYVHAAVVGGGLGAGHPAAAHPAKHAVPAGRAGERVHPRLDHRRGGAVLPRPR